MTAPSRISACRCLLLEGADRVVASGIVAIDAEGSPPVIFFDGEAFLVSVKVDGDQLYRKTRVFYAGDSFGVVR